jgi:hypothetical protein
VIFLENGKMSGIWYCAAMQILCEVVCLKLPTYTFDVTFTKKEANL